MVVEEGVEGEKGEEVVVAREREMRVRRDRRFIARKGAEVDCYLDGC